MTVSTTTSTITYQGNGATTTFSFPFIGVSASDLYVTFTDASGNSSILPDYTYTLVINAAGVGQLWGIGGTVTYPISGSPIAVGTTISITRDVPYEQTVSISNQGAFYPQAVEQGLDLLELQIQQIQRDSSYAIRCPVTDADPPDVLPDAALRANGYLGFDNTGQPTIVSSIVVTPVTYANPRKVSVSGTNIVSMSVSDSFAGVSVYQASGSVTSVQLPATGGPYPVFDGGLNAGTYHITILPPAGKTILGATTYVLAFNGQSAEFFIDDTQVLVL